MLKNSTKKKKKWK